MLHGRYADGVRPVLHDAEIQRVPAGLELHVPRLGLKAIWPLAGVFVEYDGAEVRLIPVRNEIDAGERLSLNRAAFEQEFGPVLGQFRRLRAGEASGWRIAGWSVAGLASLAFLLLVGLPFFASVAAPLVPYSWEERLGKGVEDEVLEMFGRGKKARLCTTPGTPGRAALDEMTTKLSANLRLHGPLKVDIVDVPIINAFALPGGRIYLFRPVIERASSADEVAAVLAHEIGHVVNRDSMRAVMHDGALSVLASLIIGDVSGGTFIAIFGRMMLGSAFSREQEREADRVSVQLMREAGADARALNLFFGRLLQQEGKEGQSDLFRSHPLTEERIERVERLTEDAPRPRGSILSPASWQALRRACEA
jgi:Zn-dependent protease with chaperone function